MNNYKPDAEMDISRLYDFVSQRRAFIFLRFSDGETEVLKNRELILGSEGIYFRGKNINHIYPKYDQKHFNPERHSRVRDELMKSFLVKSQYYIRGIPSKHNIDTDDQDFYLKLSKGIDKSITFADLLVNKNYKFFVKRFLPHIFECYDVHLIANYRAINDGRFASKFDCPDNFFDDFEILENECKEYIRKLPSNCCVLSSCSSFSNIVGYYVHNIRPDITFIDVGSSINHLIGLDKNTRVYHDYVFGPKTLKSALTLLKHLWLGKLNFRWN